MIINQLCSEADLGGGCRACAPSPPPPRDDLPKNMWFIGVEVVLDPPPMFW